MIECLWSCLLILAAVNRQTRPLATLLGAKAAVCYLAAYSGLWLVPPVIDLLAGSVGVWMAVRLPYPRIRALLAASFPLVMLVHAWHWGLWANGIYVGVQYWLVMLGLFSAQVLALSWPEVQDVVRTSRNSRRISRRRALAGRAASYRWRRPPAH